MLRHEDIRSDQVKPKGTWGNPLGTGSGNNATSFAGHLSQSLELEFYIVIWYYRLTETSSRT